jgi:uncharacterized membrane protein
MSLAASPLTSHIAPPKVRPDADRAHGDRVVVMMMIVVAAMMLIAGTLRHQLLRSGAFDLGFFDQAVYLISHGETPISSLHRFHVLADHASLILYPVSLLYFVWSNPHMLLISQALALTAGAWAVWRLANHAKLTNGQSLALTITYLLYPAILISSIFDFHPETFAVPGLLFAILMARENRKIAFLVCVAVVLSTKEVMALTIVAMGVWLLLFEKKRFEGLASIILGSVWFVFVITVLIPYFGDGKNASGVAYYSYLGGSVREILLNMLMHPGLVMGKIFSVSTAIYLIVLAVPIAWGLHYRTAAPLLAIVPTVMLNILSSHSPQRSPFFHYSLTVVPFAFAMLIAALATRRAWLTSPRAIAGWSIGLLVVGGAVRMSRVQSQHAFDWETLNHTRQAMQFVEKDAAVLTTFEAVPHLSHREVVEYVGGVVPLRPIVDYDYILLNIRHSSLDHVDEKLAQVFDEVHASHEFELKYEGPDVYLFKRWHLNDPPVAVQVGHSPAKVQAADAAGG